MFVIKNLIEAVFIDDFENFAKKRFDVVQSKFVSKLLSLKICPKSDSCYTRLLIIQIHFLIG